MTAATPNAIAIEDHDQALPSPCLLRLFSALSGQGQELIVSTTPNGEVLPILIAFQIFPVVRGKGYNALLPVIQSLFSPLSGPIPTGVISTGVGTWSRFGLLKSNAFGEPGWRHHDGVQAGYYRPGSVIQVGSLPVSSCCR